MPPGFRIHGESDTHFLMARMGQQQLVVDHRAAGQCRQSSIRCRLRLVRDAFHLLDGIRQAAVDLSRFNMHARFGG